ncbi:hypothetical protein K438DRAFT_1766378 [Mycena galopus ATCC 62051]|nr:hypothetical protein K438DRAFT_1766378 [Mycena galopus ATCC 62051]
MLPKYLLWHALFYLVLLLTALKRHDTLRAGTLDASFAVTLGDALSERVSDADAVGRNIIRDDVLMTDLAKLGFAATSLLSAAAVAAAPLALAVVVAALAVWAMINAEGGKMTEKGRKSLNSEAHVKHGKSASGGASALQICFTIQVLFPRLNKS